jgi:hypothetical protein
MALDKISFCAVFVITIIFSDLFYLGETTENPAAIRVFAAVTLRMGINVLDQRSTIEISTSSFLQIVHRGKSQLKKNKAMAA